MYAAHARVLISPRVAFRPFSAPGLALPIGLAVRREAPPAALDVLLKALTPPPTCNDHES